MDFSILKYQLSLSDFFLFILIAEDPADLHRSTTIQDKGWVIFSLWDLVVFLL